MGVSFVWVLSNGLLCVGERIVVSLDEKEECLVKMQTVDQQAMKSFYHESYTIHEVIQGETSQASEICPHTFSRHETISPALRRIPRNRDGEVSRRPPSLRAIFIERLCL